MNPALALTDQMLLAATPLLLAGAGELAAQRAGVLNLGCEGLMLTGCITGFAVAESTGSPWLGLIAAMTAAAALAGVFAAATVWARVDQIVAGMAVNLLAVGLSGSVWTLLQARGLGDMAPAAGFANSGWWRQAALPLIALLLASGAWILTRTRTGLVITALGDAPTAVAAAGLSVRVWRSGLVLVAGAFAGAAGAWLSTARTHAFVPEMTGGQGYLVLALVIFGRWRIGGLIAGCLLFGLVEAAQQYGQSAGAGAHVPWHLLKCLPYLTALIALAALANGSAGPRYLGRPYDG